jgi:periplasmic nitrate reductase NapD
MKIVSLVLKYFPACAAQVRAGVEAVAGATVAQDDGAGRMIVVIEDGEDYAVSDSIIQVHQVADIMSVTLAYEYSDEAIGRVHSERCAAQMPGGDARQGAGSAVQ